MKTMKYWSSFLALAGIVLMSACNQGGQNRFDLAAARKAVEEGNKMMMDHIMKGDSVGMANMYAAGAKIMAPGLPGVAKENIQHFAHGMMANGGMDFRLNTVDVWGNQDLLSEEGSWSLFDGNGTQLDHGKYIVLWKQENGQWKLFRDCWNSDGPVGGK